MKCPTGQSANTERSFAELREGPASKERRTDPGTVGCPAPAAYWLLNSPLEVRGGLLQVGSSSSV